MGCLTPLKGVQKHEAFSLQDIVLDIVQDIRGGNEPCQKERRNGVVHSCTTLSD